MAKEELGVVTLILNLAFRGTWVFSFISRPLYLQEKGLPVYLYCGSLWAADIEDLMKRITAIWFFKYNQQGAIICGLFISKSFYMFRVVPPPIIRST